MSNIIKKYKAQSVMEGAGVPVNRVFGYYEVKEFDPFLMLDYFGTDHEVDSPGFPWHPHKGIETITYMIKGSVSHEDSIGNKGTMGPGELQWMTAGRGILHQEMPGKSPNGSKGFQFWLNLPASEKLVEPNYQYIKAGGMKSYQMEGATVRVIAGSYEGVVGPIDKSNLGVSMFHITIEQGQSIYLDRDSDKNGYVVVFSGDGKLGDESLEAVTAYTLSDGSFEIEAVGDEPLEIIYAQGRPLKEPIAWRGPVVMNTQEELVQTFRDLENGNFIK